MPDKAPALYDALWNGQTDEPLAHQRPQRYLVAADDLFGQSACERARQAFITIAAAHWHTFLVLTRHPERALKFSSAFPSPPNACLFVVIENQMAANKRVMYLARHRGFRGLWCNPLLGGLELARWLRTAGIGLVVCGGETGVDARPFLPAWGIGLREQCRKGNVPFFMAQMGSVWAKGAKAKNKDGLDPLGWPTALRVREVPTAWTAGQSLPRSGPQPAGLERRVADRRQGDRRKADRRKARA